MEHGSITLSPAFYWIHIHEMDSLTLDLLFHKPANRIENYNFIEITKRHTYNDPFIESLTNSQ